VILTATAAVMCALGRGCAAPAREAPAAEAVASVRIAESRIDAIAGRPVLVPIVAGAAGAAPMSAEIDGVGAVETDVVWVAVRPSSGPVDGWLGPSGEWAVYEAPPEERVPGEVGFPAVLVRTDADAHGRRVRLGEEIAPVTWREAPPPVSMSPETPGEPRDGWTALAEPALRNPTRWWRVALARERLGMPAIAASATFAEPALAALAEQVADRWRIGLATLRESDPALAMRVTTALTRVVTVYGRDAPAWSPNEDAAARLLEDLLSPVLGADERAARARSWVDAEPQATAWVLDDAGRLEPFAGRSAVVAVVADLASRGGLAWLDAPEATREPGPRMPVSPLGSVVVMDWFPQARAPETIEARLGNWRTDLRIAAAPTAVRPPGRRMGPLLREWTMAGWLGGVALQEEAAYACAALLQPGEAGGWELYVECRVAGEGPDEVRVWLGGAEEKSPALRIERGGVVMDARTGASLSERAVFRGGEDWWSALVPLPEYAVEPPGVVRVGLERVDARGVRTTWPRPSLPWQRVPGRVALDVTRWGGVTDPGR